MAKVKQEYILEVTAKGLKEVVNEIKALRADMSGLRKSTDNTSAGFNKVSKSSGEYDRNMKGAANATNNSTKAFSKMSQGMQGSLVPAYATVAANVFALTAAFGALERAADFQILVNSAEELSTQTGRSLVLLSKNMKAITGSAISMKEALTSASIAASAGFDNSTIEKLTQVARNASVALGRDMTDSLNRVFKGAIKAEPELLDELGIILRLDPAARKYASSIGKTVAELTTFEKQQAVVNEVIAQGEEKFASLSNIDPNPFTQLSAAFNDVSTSILSIGSLTLGPVLEFFAENTGALTAALIIFANSVLQRALPALSKFGEEAQKTITKSISIQGLKAATTEAFRDYSAAVLGETTKLAEVQKTSVSLTQGLIANSTKALGESTSKTLGNIANKTGNELNRMKSIVKLTNDELATLAQNSNGANIALTAKGKALIDINGAAQNAVSKLQNLNGTASRGIKIAISAQAAWKGFATRVGQVKVSGIEGFFKGTEEGFSNIIPNFKLFNKALSATEANLGAVGKTTKLASQGVFLLSASFGSLLKIVPIIGQLVLAFQLLSTGVSWILDLFRDGNSVERFNDSLENQNQVIKTVQKSIVTYNKLLSSGLVDGIDEVTKKTTLLKNILLELSTAFEDVINNSPDFTFFDTLIDITGFGQLDNFKDVIEDQLTALTELGESQFVLDFITKFGEAEELSGDKAKQASEFIRDYQKEITKAANASFEANERLKETFKALGDSIDSSVQALPKLSDSQAILTGLDSIISSVEYGVVSVDQLSTAFETLSNRQALTIGIDSFVTQLSSLTNESDDAVKKVNALRQEITKLNASGQNEYFIAEDRSKLEDEIRDKEFQLIGIRIRSADVIDKILEKVKEHRDILRSIEDAESVISNIRARASLDLSAPNLLLLDRISILADLASEEEAFYGLLGKQSEDRIKDLEKEINTNTLLLENYKEGKSQIQGNISSGKILRGDAAEVSSINTPAEADAAVNRRRLSQQELFRLEQDVLKNRQEGSKVYINLLKTARQELVNNSEAVRLGIPGFAALSKEVKENYVQALDKAYRSVRQTGEGVEEFKDKQLTATEAAIKFKDEYANISFLGINQGVIAIGNLLKAQKDLNLELDLYKSTEGDLTSRADKNELLLQQELRLQETKQSFFLANLIEEEKLGRITSNQVAEAERSLAVTRTLIGETGKLGLAKILAYGDRRLVDLQNINKELAKSIKFTEGTSLAERKLAAQRKELERQEKAGIKKLTTADIKEINLAEDLKEIKKLQGAFDGLVGSIQGLGGTLSTLRDRLKALGEDGDPTLKLQAGLLAVNDIAEKSGSKPAQALSQISVLAAEFGDKVNKGTVEAGDGYNLLTSSIGALSGAFEEGSKAAGVLQIAELALASVKAVSAVLTQGEGDPYTAFARMAAMASTVASLLSAVGGTFGGGASVDAAGEQQVQDFKDSFGAQGVQGLDLQNNSLVESIDSLIDLETDLFGVQRDLVIATKELKESFSSIGSSLFKSGGTFSGVNILDLFGVSFGSIGKSSKLGTSSRTITNDLISAGLELSVAVSFVAGDIIASLEQARFALFQQVTVSKKSLFRSSTTTYIESIFEDLPREIREGLEKSLNSTVDFILGQFQSFGTKVQVDLTNLLSGLDNIIIDPTVLDLSDKTAQEQSEVVAAFFTGLTNDIIDQVLPFIGNFSQAGEELTDTLLRLTQQTIQLDNIFKTIGFDFTAAIPDFSGVTQTSLDLMNEAKFPDYSAALGDFTNATIEGIRDDIATQERALANLSSSGSRGLWQIKWIKNIINRLNEQLEEELIIAGKGSIEFTNVDAYVEALKIQTLAEWETALLTNFKDVDELNVVFKQFSSTLFSQAKLADIALLNAKNVVTLGFEQLVGQLNDAGLEDFVGLLGAEPTAESLRAFYEAGNAAGIFSSKFDVVTGTFDNSGADIFATLIQLGAGLDNVTNAGEGAIEAINDFNKGIQRQIDTFGLVGKELDLLQLDFEFQDALKEAEEVGGNIALVEQLFGLKRIDIIRQYNQEIVDSITATSKSINDAMLSVVNTSEAWDEVIFQSLKVEKSAKRLKTSLGSLASGLDFSIFDVDLDTTTFETLFDSILQFESEIPTNINEQIELINDLKDSILDRYNAEAAAIDNLRNLATNIGDYLDSLKLNDISPLTNVERLAEAQDQFTTNLANLNSDDAAIRAKAQQDLTSSADTYLQSAQEYFGISAGFQDIFSNVTSALQSVQADLQTDIGLSTDTLAINALQEKTLEQLSTLDSILLTLEAQNDMDFQIEINAWADAIGAGSTLNDIVIKLQSLESAVWGTALTNIGSYDTGTPEIEFDQIAKVHKGEMILTPSTSEEVREGGAFITNEENISNTQTSITGSNEDIIAAIRVLTQVLADSQEDLLEQGEKLLIKETSTTSLLPATKTTRIL